MKKSIDLIIEETKESVINILNSSGLSIGIMNLVVKDIKQTIENQAKITLEMEKIEYNKTMENLENKENIERNDEDGNK